MNYCGGKSIIYEKYFGQKMRGFWGWKRLYESEESMFVVLNGWVAWKKNLILQQYSKIFIEWVKHGGLTTDCMESRSAK